MPKQIFKLLAWPVIALISLYRIGISPLFPRTCRFYPSCSVYSIQALRKHGLFKGIHLTFQRVISCHPGNPGGYDPVP